MGIGFNKSQNSKSMKSSNTKQRNDYDLTSNLKTVGENGQSREIPQRKSPPQYNNNYDDSVFDDIEDEYYEDVVEPTPPINNRKKQQMQYVPQQKKSHKGTVFLMVVILLLLLGGFGVLCMKNSNGNTSTNINSTNSVIPDSSKIPNSSENQNVGTTQNDVSSEDDTQGTINGSSASGTLIKENEDGSTSTIPESSNTNSGSSASQNSASAGLPNFNVNTNMKSDSDVTNYSEFVKNLQGEDVKVDYTVSRIDSKQDFVNYTKYRTVTGTGIELYWLDVVYKDRSYTIIVPFKIYKELDDVGIVPVTMEVLILTDNSEIISYMEVNTEYEGGTK